MSNDNANSSASVRTGGGGGGATDSATDTDADIVEGNGDSDGDSDDSIYVICHGGPTANHWGVSVEMIQAPHWTGPWSTVRKDSKSQDVDLYDAGAALFAHPVEDPTAWVGRDGTWHMLTHAFRMGMVNATGVSGNAYGGYAWSDKADGPRGPWHFQENMPAYTGEINFDFAENSNSNDNSSNNNNNRDINSNDNNNNVWVASRRERPKVLLDPDTGTIVSPNKRNFFQ